MTETIEPISRPHLTPRQQEIYEFVWLFTETNGFCPTVREIGAQFGLAGTNAVMCHLTALRRKGYLTWEANQPRTIRRAEVDHAAVD